MQIWISNFQKLLEVEIRELETEVFFYDLGLCFQKSSFRMTRFRKMLNSVKNIFDWEGEISN